MSVMFVNPSSSCSGTLCTFLVQPVLPKQQQQQHNADVEVEMQQPQKQQHMSCTMAYDAC